MEELVHVEEEVAHAVEGKVVAVEGKVVEDVEWYMQLPELSENGLQSGYAVREHLE